MNNLNKSVVKVKKWAFLFDQSRCIGCNACTVACKDWYDVNPGPVRYRTQTTYEDEKAPYFFSFVMSCNHCDKPACMHACGAGAISKRSDGVVIIDRSKCVEAKSCLSACPFGAPGVADDRQEPVKKNENWQYSHPMQKCNMCVELLDIGEKTICERSCIAHAIEVGDYDDLLSRYPDAVRLNPADFPYAYKNNDNAGTGPNLLIKPRKPLKIIKK